MNVVCLYVDRLKLCGYDLAFLSTHWHLFDKRFIFVGDQEHADLVAPYAEPINVGITVKTNKDYGEGTRRGLEIVQKMNPTTTTLIQADSYLTPKGIETLIKTASEYGRACLRSEIVQLYSVLQLFDYKAACWRNDFPTTVNRPGQIQGYYEPRDGLGGLYIIGYLGLRAYQKKMIYQSNIWADSWKPHIIELIENNPEQAIREIQATHRTYTGLPIKFIDESLWAGILSKYTLEEELRRCKELDHADLAHPS